MPNTSVAKTKKSPWIPPPGRTQRKNKTSTKSTKDACFLVNEESGITRIKVPTGYFQFNFGPEQTEGSFVVEPCDTSTVMKNLGDDFLDTTSLSSSSDKILHEMSYHLHAIKREMKLLKIHFMSMKQISQFLLGIFSSFGIEDHSIKYLLSKTLDEVKLFISSFEDLEFSIDSTENATSENNRIEEFQKVVKLKENLLSKLLDCYSDIVTIFQTLTEKRNSELMSKSEKDQDQLRKQLQETQKKCDSKTVVITDLEKKLSLFQGKASTLESYKSTLENEKAELHKQLSYKEAQIKCLNAQLLKFSFNQEAFSSEKYLETIDKIKKSAEVEKSTLKKALKFQKLHMEKVEQLQQKMEKKLQEKEDMLFHIAAQRDQLKLHLTVANNSIIEGKTQIEEIKHQNLKLQNELCENESSLKKQLQEFSVTLNEKSAQLNDSFKEQSKLEQNLLDAKSDLELTTKELKSLKSKFTDANILSQGDVDGNYGSALENVKQLILLLQSTQEYLKNIKSTSTRAGGDNLANEGIKTDRVHRTVLTAIEEIKEHLIDLKNQYSSNSKEDDGKIELEMKLKELQKLYSTCSKENEALKAEMEEIKNSKWLNPSVHQTENYPTSYMPDGDFFKNLQMELRLKNEENWRLKQREKDLEYQLEEVKSKLQKKEAENYRLFSLEEELKSRKSEMSLLERKKEEESERLLNRIRELQKSLDETTTERERLKLYVQDVRSSYFNVFES